MAESLLKRKVYVGVNADFSSDGVLMPRSISLEDGKTYQIEHITHVQPVESTQDNVECNRYTCRINGKNAYVFVEKNGNQHRWYVMTKA